MPFALFNLKFSLDQAMRNRVSDARASPLLMSGTISLSLYSFLVLASQLPQPGVDFPTYENYETAGVHPDEQHYNCADAAVCPVIGPKIVYII